MSETIMLEDWTGKYRPRKFEELWVVDARVRYLMRALEARQLPKALLLSGSYGEGKTTISLIIAQSVSCYNRSNHNPCGECDGCQFCDTPMMGLYGSALFIQGNRYDAQALRKLTQECSRYAPPVSNGAYIVVIDEVHRVPQTDQNALLDIIEDTPHTHFILCTTHSQGILDGVRHRCIEIAMAVPSIHQATQALMRIAAAEGLAIDEQTLVAICRLENCNPRKCIQRLMQFATGGELLTENYEIQALENGGLM
jgi:DNA polymerase III subunit gamma/tau